MSLDSGGTKVIIMVLIQRWDTAVLAGRNPCSSFRGYPGSFAGACTNTGSSKRTGRRHSRGRNWMQTTARNSCGDPGIDSNRRASVECGSCESTKCYIPAWRIVACIRQFCFYRWLAVMCLPLWPARRFYHGWHALAIQRLRFTEVDNVENYPL